VYSPAPFVFRPGFSFEQTDLDGGHAFYCLRPTEQTGLFVRSRARAVPQPLAIHFRVSDILCAWPAVGTDQADADPIDVEPGAHRPACADQTDPKVLCPGEVGVDLGKES